MPQVTSELVSLVLEALPDLGPAWPSSVPCSALLLPWSRLHPSSVLECTTPAPGVAPAGGVAWFHGSCLLNCISFAHCWFHLRHGWCSLTSPEVEELPASLRLTSHLVTFSSLASHAWAVTLSCQFHLLKCFTNSWFFQCLSPLFRQPSFLTWDVLIASYFYFNIISPKPFSRRQPGWGFPFSKWDGII